MSDTILVIAEQHQGRLNRVSFETLAAAQSISRQTGWPVEIALLGDNVTAAAEELATRPAATIYAIQSSGLARYTADAYIHALQQFLAGHPQKLILLPHTYQVRDFAPALALALGTTVVPDVTGIRTEEGRLIFTRQMFQGKFSADVSFPDTAPLLMASLQSGAFRADAAEAASTPIDTVAVTISEDTVRVHPQEPFREVKQNVDLSQSEIIVAVGRGIKEQKNLALAEDLARLLGADLAASRPICDAGWLPLERQVGSSGQTIAPRLYIALGISGAIQHIVGMKSSRIILAINKDSEAPIFEIADIGAVASLFDLVPPLIEEIKKIQSAG